MLSPLQPTLSQPRFGATIQLHSSATATELSQTQAKPFQAGLDLVAQQAQLSQEIAALDDRESPATLNIYLQKTGTASAQITTSNGGIEDAIDQTAGESVVDFVRRGIKSVKTYCQGLSQHTQWRQTSIDKAVSLAKGLLSAAESGSLEKGSHPTLVSIGGKEYKIEHSAILSGQWTFQYRFSDPQQRGGPQFILQVNKANKLIRASINDPRLGQYDFIGGLPCPIQEQVAQVAPLATQLHGLLTKLHEQKAYWPSEYGLDSLREAGPGESQFQHHGYPFPLALAEATK